MVSKKVGRESSCGSSESKQQAVLRAACCVFGARCNIVRDVVFYALLSRPCAWLHLVAKVMLGYNAWLASMAVVGARGGSSGEPAQTSDHHGRMMAAISRWTGNRYIHVSMYS